MLRGGTNSLPLPSAGLGSVTQAGKKADGKPASLATAAFEECEPPERRGSRVAASVLEGLGRTMFHLFASRV